MQLSERLATERVRHSHHVANRQSREMESKLHEARKSDFEQVSGVSRYCAVAPTCPVLLQPLGIKALYSRHSDNGAGPCAHPQMRALQQENASLRARIVALEE